MNWTPEVVRVEMAYRVERALGDAHSGTTLAQVRAARRQHPSWWRRLRVHHSVGNGERSAA